jgi:hypothetical protein
VSPCGLLRSLRDGRFTVDFTQDVGWDLREAPYGLLAVVPSETGHEMSDNVFVRRARRRGLWLRIVVFSVTVSSCLFVAILQARSEDSRLLALYVAMSVLMLVALVLQLVDLRAMEAEERLLNRLGIQPQDPRLELAVSLSIANRATADKGIAATPPNP